MTLKRIMLLLFVLCTLPTAQAGLFDKTSRTKSIDELYEDCTKNAERGYYTKALEVCNRVRNVYRDSPLSTLAELTIADIYYKRGDYEQARIAYEDFSRLHPRHEKMHYVSYRIGLTIYKRSPGAAGRDQTSTKQAVNAWTGFDARFPDSEHVPEVKKYLTKARDRLARKELYIARFYAQRDAWGATQKRLEGLLKRYSDTPTAPIAMMELASAYHRWGMTQRAAGIRDLLNQQYPDSKQVNRLEKVLENPAGEKPEEPAFVRPYRVPGGMAGMAGS